MHSYQYSTFFKGLRKLDGLKCINPKANTLSMNVTFPVKMYKQLNKMQDKQ